MSRNDAGRIDATAFECAVCYAGTNNLYDESTMELQLKSQVQNCIATEGNFATQKLSKGCINGHMLCLECHTNMWRVSRLKKSCPLCNAPLFRPGDTRSLKLAVFSHEEAVHRGAYSDLAAVRAIARQDTQMRRAPVNRPTADPLLFAAIQTLQTQTVYDLLLGGATADSYTAEAESLVSFTALLGNWYIVLCLLDAGAPPPTDVHSCTNPSSPLQSKGITHRLLLTC